MPNDFKNLKQLLGNDFQNLNKDELMDRVSDVTRNPDLKNVNRLVETPYNNQNYDEKVKDLAMNHLDDVQGLVTNAYLNDTHPNGISKLDLIKEFSDKYNIPKPRYSEEPMKDTAGNYQFEDNEGKLLNKLNINSNLSEDDKKNTIVHEIAHARDGFYVPKGLIDTLNPLDNNTPKKSISEGFGNVPAGEIESKLLKNDIRGLTDDFSQGHFFNSRSPIDQVSQETYQPKEESSFSKLKSILGGK